MDEPYRPGSDPAYMMNPQPTPSGSPSGPRSMSLVYPSNSSDLAARVTEEVTVSGYPSGTPIPGGTPSITYTRSPGAAVYPSASPATLPDFSGITMVKVRVKYTWTAIFGGRPRSEETETLIAAGTKK